MNRIFEEIRNIINSHDLIAKLISLLLAVILWAHIVSTQVGEVKFKIPVEYRNLPKSMIVLEKDPPLISVILKGKKDLLRNLNTKNIKAYVDLKNPQLNKTTQYPIVLSRGELHDNIEIATSKNFITLTVEKKITRRLPVRASFEGKVTGNYIMGNPSMIPSYVSVAGPESIITSVEYIKTEPVRLADRKSTFETTADFDIGEFKKITVSPDSIKVMVPVISLNDLYVTRVPVSLVNTADNEVVSIKPDSIQIYTRKKDIDEKPDKDDIRAYVDFNSFDKSLLKKKGDITISTERINIVSSKNIPIFRVLPETITLEMEFEDI